MTAGLIAPTAELHIDSIIIEGRHRHDLGDIKALAASIDTIGLIHPVVVTPDNRLVAGERRIAAMRSLGWETVPVTVIHTLADATDQLIAERDENTCRKDFVPSEILALGRQLEELERPKAADRQREGQEQGRVAQHSGLAPTEAKPAKGPRTGTADIVGEALGVSRGTYQRLKTVDNATRHEDEGVRDVALEQMAKLDAGETSPRRAAEVVIEKRKAAEPGPSEPEPEVIPGLPSKVYGRRPNHFQILNRIIVGLEGTAIVLADIEELNDTISAEKALRLTKDLSPSIRALNRINRLLKERTK
jgi:ParB-like chromosome segregation protein Spo0J